MNRRYLIVYMLLFVFVVTAVAVLCTPDPSDVHMGPHSTCNLLTELGHALTNDISSGIEIIESRQLDSIDKLLTELRRRRLIAQHAILRHDFWGNEFRVRRQTKDGVIRLCIYSVGENQIDEKASGDDLFVEWAVVRRRVLLTHTTVLQDGAIEVREVGLFK